MIYKIVGLFVLYCGIIYIVGKTIGDMTQSDEKLLDTFKTSD